MTRAVWKNPFIDNTFLKSSTLKKRRLVIWSRRSTILPYLINKSIDIYNGRKFINTVITKDMVGHKLGEFSPTRSIYYFKGKRK